MAQRGGAEPKDRDVAVFAACGALLMIGCVSFITDTIIKGYDRFMSHGVHCVLSVGLHLKHTCEII